MRPTTHQGRRTLDHGGIAVRRPASDEHPLDVLTHDDERAGIEHEPFPPTLLQQTVAALIPSLTLACAIGVTAFLAVYYRDLWRRGQPGRATGSAD
ncbi:MAG: hypothetical protein EXR71_06865 [Myxococcales bacterium]|nr:hypothetical protein [Myxococcales bacterium]